ncbi:MAG: MC/SLC25 family protein [Chlamydiota bacterium]
MSMHSTNLDAPPSTLARQMFQGGIASLLVNGVSHPIYTLKTRSQSAELAAISRPTQMAPQWRGLYNGFGAISATDAVVFSVAFIANDWLKERYSELWASVGAGVLCSPFVAIGEGLTANRQMTQTPLPYSTVFKRAFRPAGFGLTVMREIPFTMAVFYTPHYLGLYARNFSPFQDLSHFGQMGVQVATAGLSGAAAGFLSNPIDVLKTRVQTAEVPRSFYSVLQQTLVEEGWRGLRKGGGLRMLQIGVVSACMHTIKQVDL